MTPTPWRVNHMGVENADNYVNAIINICENRGIPYLDLYHKSQLRPWIADFNEKYFYNGDGTHPLNIAHKEFIYPLVREFIKTLL